MIKGGIYQYYVEGEDEKSLIEVLKRDFISCNNLAARLKKCNFDVAKLWSRVPNNSFGEFGNDADKIKI